MQLSSLSIHADMPRYLSLLLFLLAVAQTECLELGHAHRARFLEIRWSPCDINGTLSVLCGNLSVPLDYTNPSSDATLDIELLKTPAVNKPSRGSILFNFGGPGADGRADFAYYGPRLQA